MRVNPLNVGESASERGNIALNKVLSPYLRISAEGLFATHETYSNPAPLLPFEPATITEIEYTHTPTTGNEKYAAEALKALGVDLKNPVIIGSGCTIEYRPRVTPIFTPKEPSLIETSIERLTRLVAFHLLRELSVGKRIEDELLANRTRIYLELALSIAEEHDDFQAQKNPTGTFLTMRSLGIFSQNAESSEICCRFLYTSDIEAVASMMRHIRNTGTSALYPDIYTLETHLGSRAGRELSIASLVDDGQYAGRYGSVDFLVPASSRRRSFMRHVAGIIPLLKPLMSEKPKELAVSRRVQRPIYTFSNENILSVI